MATLSDLLTEIDNYMQNNGGGASYLATKMGAIFDEPDAPLNAKTGPLNDLATKIKDTLKKVDAFSNNIGKVAASLGNLNSSIKDLNKVIRRNIGTLTAIMNQYKGFKMKTILDAMAKNTTTALPSFDMDKFATKLATKVAIGIARVVQTINSKESLLTPKSTAFAVSITVDGKPVGPENPIPVFITGLGSSIFNRLEYFSNKNRHERRNERDSGSASSIIGKLIKFIVGAVAFVGLAGFAKQFFESSPLGKYALETVKSFFSNMSKKVGEFINDPKTKKVFGDGITAITSALSFIINGISDFIVKNKGAIWDYTKIAFTKMWEGIKKGLEFKEGSSMTEKIIKVLTGWFILRSLPIVGRVVKLVESLTGSLMGKLLKGMFNTITDLGKHLKGPLVGLLSRLGGWLKTGISRLLPILRAGIMRAVAFLGPWGIAITAAVAALTYFVNKFKGQADELHKNIQDSSNVSTNITVKESQIIARMTKELETLKKKELKTKEDEINIQLKAAQIERKKAESELRSQIQVKEAEEGSYWGTFRNSYTNFVEKDIKKIQDAHSKNQESNDKLIQQLQKQLKEEQGLKKDGNELQKKSNELQRSTLKVQETYTNSLNKEYLKNKANADYFMSDKFSDALGRMGNSAAGIKKVNDAIIVEPHSKDQVVMAKTDGPIDLALKDLNKKFDTLAMAFAEGCLAIVQATINGSNNVAQTVASTAGSGGGGNANAVTQAGADAIAGFRNRAREVFKR